jgi:hypothetical protein
MKMKLILPGLLLIVLALISVTIQSCKKYPEDSTISLKSRKERVTNTWDVDNYKINGSDYTSLVSSYIETFTNNGDYDYNWGLLDGSGTWSFQNNDNEIKLIGSDDQSSRTLFILKLEEKTFWYYYMVGSDKHEFHLIAN